MLAVGNILLPPSLPPSRPPSPTPSPLPSPLTSTLTVTATLATDATLALHPHTSPSTPSRASCCDARATPPTSRVRRAVASSCSCSASTLPSSMSCTRLSRRRSPWPRYVRARAEVRVGFRVQSSWVRLRVTRYGWVELAGLATLPFPRRELEALYSSLYVGSSSTQRARNLIAVF